MGMGWDEWMVFHHAMNYGLTCMRMDVPTLLSLQFIDARPPFMYGMHTQYTHIIEEMDAGNLPLFNHIVPPPIAISYWKLGACKKGQKKGLPVQSISFLPYKDSQH